MQMLTGGALLVGLGTISGEWSCPELIDTSMRSWAALGYLIVFGSLVVYTAYIWLLRHVEVAKVSTYAYVNPVVAVVLGWALAGEPLTVRTIISAAVIVAAVAFLTTARRLPAASRDRPVATGGSFIPVD